MRIRPFTLLFMSLIVVPLILAATGCSSMKSKNKVDVLDSSVRSYAQHIRWKRFDIAESLQKMREGEPPPVDEQRLKDVHVTRFETSSIIMDDEKKEARVKISYSYYFDANPVVREATATQLWWFDETSEHWFLDGGLPEFK